MSLRAKRNGSRLALFPIQCNLRAIVQHAASERVANGKRETQLDREPALREFFDRSAWNEARFRFVRERVAMRHRAGGTSYERLRTMQKNAHNRMNGSIM